MDVVRITDRSRDLHKLKNQAKDLDADLEKLAVQQQRLTADLERGKKIASGLIVKLISKPLRKVIDGDAISF